MKLDSHLIAKTSPHAKKENTVVWNNSRVTVLDERLFRIEAGNGGKFCDDATASVWFRDLPKVEFSADEKDGSLHIKTSLAELVFTGDLASSYVVLNNENVSLDNSENLGGTISTLDGCNGNEHWKYHRELKGVVHSNIVLGAGVVSRNGVAVLDDSKSAILMKNGMAHKRKNDGYDVYVFAFGHDYRGAVKAYYMITGKTPMIPRFALGNWWSRYHAYTDKEYLNVLYRMEERDVPITVATVDMDWHWNTYNLDKAKHITEQGKDDEYHGGTSGWTGYSWNTDLFPDYKAFLKKLHEHVSAVTLNLHPATGVRWFEDMYAEMAEAMGIDPKTEARVEMNFLDPRFINAYFKILHKPYEKDGVDFWWIDWQQGPRYVDEGVDVLWALNHYHTLDNAKGHKTPIILSRYCGTGAHRYPLGFSGDTHMTWETLRYLPYFTSTASNIGYSWWSHDIGGHFDGEKSNELYLRSVQFGVFSPINRLHSTDCDHCTKESFAYTNGTGLIADEFMRIRYAMIPFLYSAGYETTNNGRALIEPMYYEYPENEEAYEVSGQYLFGGQLIVCPITEKSDAKGMNIVRVWLPEGEWTDIFTGDKYRGGRYVNMVRTLDSIPVLAKGGAILPLDARKHTNRTDVTNELKVLAFNGNGEYVLHESEKSDADTVFVSELKDGVQTLTVKTAEKSVKRRMKVEFRNIKDGKATVVCDGQPVKNEAISDEFISVTFDVEKGKTYSINVEFTEDKRQARNDRFLYALTRIESSIKHKNKLWGYRTLDDAEFRTFIENDFAITANERVRLLECLEG